jgi:hypothetical protein
MNRNLQIRSSFDSSGKGLEIGAGYSPIVPQRGGFQGDIIDYLPA